jgi:CheY-like chemotaxis protein
MAKILIVDDHPDMREVVGQMLKLHGHTIALAETGEGAWDQICHEAPDAVVVDQRLPGISGLDLLRRIRQTTDLSQLAVVLCSGDDTERDAAHAAGATGFWLKGSDGMFESIAQLGERLGTTPKPEVSVRSHISRRPAKPESIR